MNVGFGSERQEPLQALEPQVTVRLVHTPAFTSHSMSQGPLEQLSFAPGQASLAEHTTLHSCPSGQLMVAPEQPVTAKHWTLQ